MKDAAIKAAKLLAINAGILIGSVMVLYLFSILIVLSIFILCTILLLLQVR